MALTQPFLKQAKANSQAYRPPSKGIGVYANPAGYNRVYYPDGGGFGTWGTGAGGRTNAPASNPGSTPSASTQSAPPDPYQKWGGKAGYDTAVTDYNNLRGTTFGSIDRAVGQGGTDYKAGILGYLDGAKQTRRTLDSRYVQNELGRRQGAQGVTDMIGNGIRSAGVMAANAGGGSSESAREAFARAYGTIGRQEMSGVNNQFAQGQTAIGADEENFAAANQSQTRKFEEGKIGTVNNIVNSAVAELTKLNERAASASLPDRVNIDAEVNRIKQQALQALSAYDSEMSNGIGGLKPKAASAVKSEAQQQLAAGVVPEDQFDYTSEIPLELQGTGDFASSLPIFVAPKKSDRPGAV